MQQSAYSARCHPFEYISEAFVVHLRRTVDDVDELGESVR